MCERDCSRLIAVTDRKLCEGDFLQRIDRITDRTGLRALILRERDLTDEAYGALAAGVYRICRAHGVPMFVHSRPEVARELGCRYLHLPIPALRALASGGGRRQGALAGFEEISVSCHSREDVAEAVSAGADRIILGTIFETDCKKGLRGKGTDFVREIAAGCPVPVYAIGGIKMSNLASVIAAGAAGGCMMSGFMRGEIPPGG